MNSQQTSTTVEPLAERDVNIEDARLASKQAATSVDTLKKPENYHLNLLREKRKPAKSEDSVFVLQPSSLRCANLYQTLCLAIGCHNESGNAETCIL